MADELAREGGADDAVFQVRLDQEHPDLGDDCLELAEHRKDPIRTQIARL
jgi:hypothetical protein